MTLVRPASSVAWELRTAWATRRVVVLALSERCWPMRLEGRVDAVAATDTYCVVAGYHVPLDDVLGVFRPHYSQREEEVAA